VGWQVSGELAAGSACCVTQGLLARGTDVVGWRGHRTGVLSMLLCTPPASPHDGHPPDHRTHPVKVLQQHTHPFKQVRKMSGPS
jgi:hypothetical protein